jgi:hypothetical protein
MNLPLAKLNRDEIQGSLKGPFFLSSSLFRISQVGSSTLRSRAPRMRIFVNFVNIE